MRHTVTITFETDDNLTEDQLEAIEKVACDMRWQLDSLIDNTYDTVDYYNATVDITNDKPAPVPTPKFDINSLPEPLRKILTDAKSNKIVSSWSTDTKDYYKVTHDKKYPCHCDIRKLWAEGHDDHCPEKK